MGTPHYMSPEACAGERVGKPADMWALGVVRARVVAVPSFRRNTVTIVQILYELMTLQKPFPGGTLPVVMLAIMRGVYTPLPDRYSPELRALVASLLKVPLCDT